MKRQVIFDSPWQELSIVSTDEEVWLELGETKIATFASEKAAKSLEDFIKSIIDALEQHETDSLCFT